MKLSIGLMSGTSMDGIDAAIIQTNGLYSIISQEKASLEYPQDFKVSLKQAEKDVRAAKSINVIAEDLIKKSTQFHSEIVKEILRKASLKPNEIDCIGYHGQTLYHNPKEKITIQIGDGQLLANLTEINVINDFRSNDVNHGGQGAPLAPLYHLALAIRDNYYPVAIVNCGGIANVTIINGEDEIYGFDTGPGNVLLDRLIREKTNNLEFMDLDGKYSLKGEVNNRILSKMMLNIQKFIDINGPKSLDSGDLDLPSEIYKLSIEDACATLANFTAKTIVDSIKTTIPQNWVLAGGGWKNPTILKFLKNYLIERRKDVQVHHASDIGWDSVYMEAEIFAYLAVRSLYKLPISLAKITGAPEDLTGGKLYLPSSKQT